MNRPTIPLAPDDLLVTIAGLLCRIAAPPHRRPPEPDIAVARGNRAETGVDAGTSGKEENHATDR